MVYNHKMIRILALFLIFMLFELQAFAFFEVPEQVLQNTVFINQNKKIFKQNIHSFENFLSVQQEFPSESRFIAPTFTLNKQKDLRLIAFTLYFNALKNEELQNIQKQEITLQKAFLDETKKCCNFKEIQKANEDYNQAQIDYLAYKKAFGLCEKQLKNFSGISFDFSYKLADFDLEKAMEITDKTQFTPEQRDLSEHLKYEYKKYKNLEDRTNKQPTDAETEYNLLELQKSLTITKLRCIIYYFSLEELLK